MMIIMTLKIITEIVNQIKSNQIKTKEKKKRNNKSQTKTHTQKEEKKKTEAVVYNNKNKTIKNKKTNIVWPKWNRGMQKEVLIPKI